MCSSSFQSTPDDNLICSLCEFTYYDHFTPPPAGLETQDEILLVNLPFKWQLVCDNQIERPIPLDSAIYAVVNKNDLCTCGISAQHIFLYESMHTCTNPDASVTLYYIHSRALLAMILPYVERTKKQNNITQQFQNIEYPISHTKISLLISLKLQVRTQGNKEIYLPSLIVKEM